MRSTVPVILVLASLLAVSPFPAGASDPATPFAFTNYAATGGLGGNGGEPSIGVNTRTGAVFVQALAQTLKVDFDDSVSPASAAWSNVASPLTPFFGNVDPALFTDTSTGRTFAGGLEGDCSLLFYTDDDGVSWTTMADSCTAPAFDHETIGSGPYHDPAPPGALYERAVYYCAQGIVQECAVSWNGGITFNPPALISTVCTNAVGHVKVGPDGTAFVPAKNCGSRQAVMVSTDNGLLWSTRTLADSTLAGGFNDPSVATTPSGWLYGSWLGADNHARVALSKTNATTWGPTTDLSAIAGLGTASFVTAVAGDDERAAVAFLGSTSPGGFTKTFTGTWDVYVGTTLDSGATWTVTKATSDPVQRGWICTSGTTCDPLGAGGETGRNLLDFIGVTTDEKGRVLVAYADGCIGACADALPNSWTQLASIARQTCGPSLYAAFGNVEGNRACPIGIAPPPLKPVALRGVFFARGTAAPVQTADLAVGFVVSGDGLSTTPPITTVPKVASNMATQHGANSGTIWDAHWALSANGRTLEIKNHTVTVRLYVTAAHDPTTTGKLRVALFDTTSFGDVANPVVTQDVDIPATAVMDEIVVVFPRFDATFTQGLQLYVDDIGTGETTIYYDSSLTPTSVTIRRG